MRSDDGRRINRADIGQIRALPDTAQVQIWWRRESGRLFAARRERRPELLLFQWISRISAFGLVMPGVTAAVQ